MKCSKCGNIVSESDKFCTHCGSKITPIQYTGKSSEQSVQNQSMRGQNRGSSGIDPKNIHSYPPPEPPKTTSEKKKSKWPIVLIIILAIAFIALAAVLITRLITKGKNSDSPVVYDAILEQNETDYSELGDGANATNKANSSVTAAETQNAQKSIDDSESPDKTISVQVQQVDATDYPVTRLYLTIQDSSTQTVPEDLIQDFFYIEKKDANGTYVRQTVSKVTQLNESEALSIDMVSDISGSMDGSPIQEAKRIMSSFVNSVQFDIGDQVELTTFATGVSIKREFTGDWQTLLNDIDILTTEDMTALYDALYTGVQRTATQSGARCIIAFTDGQDNYSNCTPTQVIEASQRYRIPIFIIGIGNVDTSDLQWICNETGGRYFSISEVSSMEDIYNEIYRTEKEMYLLEFEDISGEDISSESDIRVGYRSNYYGGETTYNYTANILVSANNNSIYTSGPEAVVEKYIRGFATAMTTSDFSNIEPYLLPGSNIYYTQQSYIQQNISETLDSCEIVSTVYNGSDSCVVTTRETYYVQKPNKHLELMTQECQYIVVQSGGSWYLSDFASSVNVLSRINP